MPAASQTLFRVFCCISQIRPDRPAIREKDWATATWTWAQALEGRSLACVSRQGFGAVTGLAGSATPTGLYGPRWPRRRSAACRAAYQDASPRLAFVLNDADVGSRPPRPGQSTSSGNIPQCPKLGESTSTIARAAPRSSRRIDEPRRVQRSGGNAGRTRILRCRDRKAAGRHRGLLYHLGTTCNPKAVAQTHAALSRDGAGPVAFDGFTERDEVSHLPMAWVGDSLFYAQSLVAGFCLNCPASPATVDRSARDRADYYFGPRAVYENSHTGDDPHRGRGLAERRMFHAFMGVARCRDEHFEASPPVSLKDRLLYAWAACSYPVR